MQLNDDNKSKEGRRREKKIHWGANWTFLGLQFPNNTRKLKTDISASIFLAKEFSTENNFPAW